MDASRFRSILFVPGDSPEKLAKAPSVPADALIVDWEDAVADESKTTARKVTKEAMARLAGADAAVLIRVNANRPDLVGQDCRAVLDCAPDGVVIPGCESRLAVNALLERLSASVAIFPLIESPMGVLAAAEIATSCDQVPALMFGAEDYSAEARIIRTEAEPELAFARSCVVNAARAAGREVFDSPLMQFEDANAVRRSAWRGRRLGFTGQAAIHPSQVPVINEVFCPSRAEIEAASAVLERYRAHGGGVYAVDGSLEDKPAVENALRVLARKR